ncbi:hypothetical protein [Chondromyces crocatus]|uniref:Uncharacterized protein n=1 Tax=Chondromyces crocatus TaxID=52 RepID=A0A0K1E782_CHOCO|nr:hypothetical protein [Chondromyces crocatus]AKT36736.1 uncharacterized protein CMC5_008570 [Chondromyces crocatus]
MNRREQDLPPLPEDLARGFQALRAREPSEDLVTRAFAALPTRRPTEATEGASTQQRGNPRWLFGGLALVPALAALAVAVHLAGNQGDPIAALERFEERAVGLDEVGQTWAELDLWTHHHAGRASVVHLEVPERVSVRVPGEDGSLLEHPCIAPRCVHRFTHSDGGGTPVRVAFQEPGRYEIQVRHESKEARVRERFVVNAVRD